MCIWREWALELNQYKWFFSALDCFNIIILWYVVSYFEWNPSKNETDRYADRETGRKERKRFYRSATAKYNYQGERESERASERARERDRETVRERKRERKHIIRQTIDRLSDQSMGLR